MYAIRSYYAGQDARAPREPACHRHPVAVRATQAVHQHHGHAAAQRAHRDALTVVGGDVVLRVVGAAAQQPQAAQRAQQAGSYNFV